MTYDIEKYVKNGYEITISYDESYHYWDELWESVTFISNHRDYSDKGNLNHMTIQHVLNNELPEGYQAIQINAYIHSCIKLTVDNENTYPFNCPFDSGIFGFILFKEGDFGENNKGIDSFVQYWENLLNGFVYCYCIEKDNEIVDSCCGFTDIEYMKEELNNAIEYHIHKLNLKKQSKLKELIKHRVNLEKRIHLLNKYVA